MPTFKEGVEVLNNPQAAELESSGQKRLLSLQRQLLKTDWSHAKDFNPWDIVKEYETTPGFALRVRDALAHIEDEEGPYCRRTDRVQDYDIQIEHYLKPDVPNRYSNPHYNWALNVLRQYFSLFKVEPERILSREDIDNVLSTLKSSAGWDSVVYPGMQTKRHFVYPEDYAHLESAQRFIAEWGDVYGYYRSGLEQAKINGTWGAPTICFSRTQASVNWDDYTCKRKRRLVQCVGLRETILGRRYLKPVDEVMSAMPIFGPGKTRNQLGGLMLQMQSESLTSWTWDYSKYDSTIPAWGISDAFSVMREMFHGSEEDAEWELMVHDFIHKTILSHDAWYSVHHGTASGHPATTAVNCIFNALMTLTLAHRFEVKLAFNIFGDDNCVSTLDRPVEREEFEEMCAYLTTMFGIECNPTKSSFRRIGRDEYPEYLSTVWRPEGAWRDARDLIDHMIYPERYRVYGADLQPWIVVFDYILAYPAGMREFMRVDDFIRDYGASLVALKDNPRTWRDLPYNVRTTLDGMVKSKLALTTYAEAEWRKVM